MAQALTVRHKLDLRRSITTSAFVMMLLVAVMGLFALFSIWSINRAWTEGMNRSAQLREISTAALEAQVAFKVQVQEWKNILLRGDDPALLAKHHDAFSKQAAAARGLLASVAAQAGELGFSADAARAAALVAAHDTVTRNYEDTLAAVEAGAPALAPDAARRIDQRLRGVDRELESGIATLAIDIGKAADARRDDLIAGMNDRYQALRWFIISVILGAMLVTGYVLFGLIRATRA